MHITHIIHSDSQLRSSFMCSNDSMQIEAWSVQLPECVIDINSEISSTLVIKLLS